jgi:hypothetical protein
MDRLAAAISCFDWRVRLLARLDALEEVSRVRRRPVLEALFNTGFRLVFMFCIEVGSSARTIFLAAS